MPWVVRRCPAVQRIDQCGMLSVRTQVAIRCEFTKIVTEDDDTSTTTNITYRTDESDMSVRNEQDLSGFEEVPVCDCDSPRYVGGVDSGCAS